MASLPFVIDDLQRLLGADALDGLTTRPMEALREDRAACQSAEADVSLVRRVTQGRLDIVGHEVRRREGEVEGDADVAGLLFDLPEILTADAPAPAAETSGGEPPLGRRQVSIDEPGQVAHDLVAALDQIASPGALAGLESRRAGELRELFEQIRAFEVELSGIRRQLHERIDTFQAEIGRRYRDGEASVDALLS